ncbi:MAG: tRNA (N6-isopentenyl adenosine(37)-C2)-methylthiotransferase MiaB [Bacillota bacterium]|nr:tRNA (N6-isopentenyl adenosine(37)-C2)-methylthiotransferase MiaB [Bacillota bacterium]
MINPELQTSLQGAAGPRRYWIRTFGCQQNDHDSEIIAGLLEASGLVPAASLEDCDLAILNSCSIRENADGRFYGHLGIVKAERERRPELLVAVCGCMPLIEEHVERIRRSYSFVDLVFGPEDIPRLPQLLRERLESGRKVREIDRASGIIAEGLPVVRARRFRALVTIMTGCDNYCSYCIVPYTRGRERSRDSEAILAEVRQLVSEGYGEVMLLGQNVNSWNRKRRPDSTDPPGRDFAWLLEQVAATGIPRIRFMTSNPRDLSSGMLAVMERHANIERHLHLPLQSGSDRVLAQMNRHYDRARYLAIVAEARRRIPDIAFSTDIIVGFPGETEADFAETLSLVEEVAFDSAFLFQYSPRYGTPAALLARRIPPEIMRERFDRLLSLQNRLSEASNHRLVGRELSVLIEGAADHRPGLLLGRSSSNHLVNFALTPAIARECGVDPGDSDRAGELLEGRFARVRVEAARMLSTSGTALAVLPAGEGAP